MYARIDSVVISTQTNFLTLGYLWYRLKFEKNKLTRKNLEKKRSNMLKILKAMDQPDHVTKFL